MTDTGIALIPRPVEAGAEMEALQRFHRDVTWQGRIEEGGMGPGTPAQTATGKAVHHWIQNGRWVVGEFEQDQFLEDGTFILKWELHWVCGWDPFNREYRATVADCYGHTEIMRGRIDGDIMVFESMRDTPPMLKMTWDVSSPDVLLWRNEMSLDGSDWMLVEEYEMIPID
ncbi:MAG TPA: DUF1579 family protein [Acidimicrobiia bacterium]|nr:DUF1579 family protein [Acidimicrobiia bacterium]